MLDSWHYKARYIAGMLKVQRTVYSSTSEGQGYHFISKTEAQDAMSFIKSKLKR